jgi:hypothetical protein
VSDTDTTTDAGEARGPAIFSPDDSVEKLWVQAYQGEVLGQSLFGRLADRLSERGEADHAAKMRVLTTLKRRTKEAVAPAVARAGLPTEDDPEMLRLAEAVADGSPDGTWEELMASLASITLQFIPLYARIGELSPSEAEAAELLIAHEVALREFALAELDGDPGTSLDRIDALAHMH